MLCRKHWKNSVLYVSILFQVAQRSLGLLSVFTLVRNSKAKALTLKEYLFLWHFGHWQQLVLTPYSQFITGHIYRCTGCTSPLEQLCPAGKLGQRAAWQSAAGLWSARYRRFVYMGKSRWTQGTVCTVNLLQEIWDQLGRHVGAVAWMIDWYLSKDFSSFSVVPWEGVTELAVFWQIITRLRTNIYLPVPAYTEISKNINGL